MSSPVAASRPASSKYRIGSPPYKTKTAGQTPTAKRQSSSLYQSQESRRILFYPAALQSARKPEDDSSAAYVRAITINVCECQTHSGFSLFEIFISICLFSSFVNPIKRVLSIIYYRFHTYNRIKKELFSQLFLCLLFYDSKTTLSPKFFQTRVRDPHAKNTQS